MEISELRKYLQSELAHILKLDQSIALLEADLLILHELRIHTNERARLYTMNKDVCDDKLVSTILDNLARRTGGEPLAYILGEKEFFSYPFYVDNRVLIPRPETELLVSKSLEILKDLKNQNILIADLGTGSGAIILSLLSELKLRFKGEPRCLNAFAADISKDAVEVATLNAERFGLQDDLKIYHKCMFSFLESDEFIEAYIESDIAIIISNPPYLDTSDPLVLNEVKKFEPHLALFSNDQGYQHIMQIIDVFTGTCSRYPQDLKNANLLMEIGYNQSNKLLSYALNFKEFKTEILKDLAGLDRVFMMQPAN